MKTRWIGIFLVSVGLCGCALPHKTTAPETARWPPPAPPPSAAPAPSEVFGPSTPPVAPQYGPVPAASRPIVLVLGPGLARGYAYTGVIRALVDAKVRIGAVIGTEMGALIGALYALDGNVNRLEWRVQRFREEAFATDESMLSKLFSDDPAEKLEESLKKVFGSKDVSQTKIPLRILAQGATGQAKVFDQGQLRLIVRAALGGVDRFPAERVLGESYSSAGGLRPFDVTDARALGIGPVVAVNVLDAQEAASYSELRQADLVIEPAVTAMAKTDFSSRTDAVFAGKTAVESRMDDIKKLIGGTTP